MGFTSAERAELERFHQPTYLAALESGAMGRHKLAYLEMGLDTPDCPIFPDIFAYARLARGGTLAPADLILKGQAHFIFNPSGGFHHAGPATSPRFCYLNDVALAGLKLAEAGSKVFVLELDVHHGGARGVP